METPVRKPIRKRPWPLLVGLLGVLGLLGYLVLNFPPTFLIVLGTFHLSIVIPFFILLFLIFYCVIAYLMNSALQGVILAAFCVGYIIMRFFGLTHPLFALLLLGVLGCIEFAIYKRK